MVLEAAVNGRADLLLTFNLRHFAGSEPAGCAQRASRPGMAAMERGRGMTRANYALRLQAGLKAEAERVAKREGTTLNQFINFAVAEKLSALRTVDYFRERAARAKVEEAWAILERAGTDEPPREDDELEPGTTSS